MDADERSRLIERYREGARLVAEAVAGRSDADLDRPPDAGGWTPRQIVHHLADAEMVAAVRVRRLLAESRPLIPAYDEAAYAEQLHYERPIEGSLEAIRWACETTAAILERFGEEEWAREAVHAETGPYTLADWLRRSTHCHDHAAQIRYALARITPGS
jgi:hypothetical protein